MFRQSKRMIPDMYYSANAIIAEDIPRDRLIKNIVLHLYGEIKTVGGDAAQADNPMSLISRIEVIADGSLVLYSLTGIDAYYLTQHLYGAAPLLNAVANTAADDQYIDCLIIIPFHAYGARVPADTFLDATAFKSLQIKIHWGDIANLHNGTVTEETDIRIRPEINETVKPEPNFLSKWYTLEKNVTATDAQFDVDLPLSNFYRAFMFRQLDDSVRVNTVVNRVNLISSGSVFHIQNVFDSLLRNEHALYQLLASTDGVTFVDWIGLEDGIMKSVLSANDTNDLKLRFDVTKSQNDCKLYVVVNEIIPPIS